MHKIERRNILAAVTVCLLGMAVPTLATCDEPESNRPNILFLLIDDQRNDTLGCTGHPIIKTPVVDSLAAEGVRFQNAFVTTSICTASRASRRTLSDRNKLRTH